MKKNKKTNIYNITTILMIVLFSIMVIVFCQNIILKIKRNALDDSLEEYKILKEEINSLIEVKENYEIVIKNNEKLESQKSQLKNKITELNKEISKLEKKIDKLK